MEPILFYTESPAFRAVAWRAPISEVTCAKRVFTRKTRVYARRGGRERE